MNRLYTEYTSRATWKIVAEILDIGYLYSPAQRWAEEKGRFTAQSIEEFCTENSSSILTTENLNTVDWQQVADEINHDLGYGLPEAYPIRYTVKVSIIAVDTEGREIDTPYSMTYGGTTKNYDGLESIVDSSVDYYINGLWQDDLVAEETEETEENG